MKISKLEFLTILLTAACLAFALGWFLRGDVSAQPMRVTVERSLPAAEEPLALPSPPEPSAGEAGTVNINTAGVDELQTLPGIGEKRAEDIVAYRGEHGPFRIVEDITKVKGIGEGILEQIIGQITVE